jgi:CheY-like chemotaxis protein
VALVLIVVDEPETMLLLCRGVEAGGHNAVLAADADTALQRLAAMPVDLVVLDVMMPVHDGWTVLRALGNDSQPVPAIVMLGRAGPAALERATLMGAVGTLAAPFTPKQLLQAVDLALTPIASS